MARGKGSANDPKLGLRWIGQVMMGEPHDYIFYHYQTRVVRSRRYGYVRHAACGRRIYENDPDITLYVPRDRCCPDCLAVVDREHPNDSPREA